MSIKWKILAMSLAGILLTASGTVTLVAIKRMTVVHEVHDTLGQLAEGETDKVASTVYRMVQAQHQTLLKTLDADLNVAADLIDRAGGLGFDPAQPVAWRAVNQFTQQGTDVSLPQMSLGEATLEPNRATDVPTPLVDHVGALVDARCTIFQRMNQQGDLLRVATNVVKADGQRAVGTFIPAINPDGQTNPVVAKVLAGETYYGRAYVVDDWYLTVYQPLKDDAGHVVGVLSVAVRIESVDALRQGIMQVEVGKTGYVYVLGGSGSQKGQYIISYQGKRDGENILAAKDANGDLFIQNMIDRAVAVEPGETAIVRYPWQNANEGEPRGKVAAMTYFEPWDWVIGASAYEDDFEEAEYQVNAAIGSLLIWTVIGSAIALLVCGLLTAIGSNRLVRPLNRVTDALRDIAEGDGDLTQRLDASSHDEVGRLAGAFNTFVGKVHGIIRDVAGATQEVASAANEIAATSEEMASGMREQSGQTTQVSAAVEEMGATVVEVARKSAEAANAAGEAGSQAQGGGTVVGQNIEQMQDLARLVNATAKAIDQLGQRSEEIGRVIEVINEIADQTNLLALNAAIEAARAGEHGRGFAVVADEVRKLADRTTKATEEIVQSINLIQGETSGAVQQMAEGTTQVDRGVEQATEAGRSLEQIVAGAESVATMIQSIAAAADQQAAAAEQISRNVESIDALTTQSAEGASQGAIAATQLSDKAVQLERLVSQFKLEA